MEANAYAADSAHGYTVAFSANLKSGSPGLSLGPVCEPLGQASSAPGCAPLSAYLDAVVSSSPDVLLVSSNGGAFKHVLHYLSDQRPKVDRGEVLKDTAALSALFWVGVPWLQNGEPACSGLRSHCSHAIGATQISQEEADMYADQLLLSAGVPATYDWLRKNHTKLAAAYIQNVTKAEADAAVIPSIIAQAIQKLFRFRTLVSRQSPLRQAGSADYEALRSYIASGEVVARTYYGPVSFDAFGNNAGREASVFQAQDGGSVVTTFPATLIGSKPHRYPVPALEMAPLGAGAYALNYGPSCDSTRDSENGLAPCGAGGPSCLLCAPITYEEQFPFKWVLLASIAGSSFLVLLMLGCLYGRRRERRKVRLAKEEVAAEAAEAAAASAAREEEQRRKKMEAEVMAEKRRKEILAKEESEVRAAINAAVTLQYSAAVVRAERFIGLGRLVKYEELRDSGGLLYLDSIDELLASNDKMIFISHQWTGNLQPDQQFTVEEQSQMRAESNTTSDTVEGGEVKTTDFIVIEEKGEFVKVRKKQHSDVSGWLSRRNPHTGKQVVVERHISMTQW